MIGLAVSISMTPSYCPAGSRLRAADEADWWDAVVDGAWDAVQGPFDPKKGTFATFLRRAVNWRLTKVNLRRTGGWRKHQLARVDTDLFRCGSREPESWVYAVISEAARATAPSG